ncbi:MAG: patatin-like phospholipase family protein [Acidobacteria bacterium]|nr:patatin-like phospholipase family protein [Acidobacteriota bacterium]
MQPYSPERRTALVLCGTGAHGAYHAGVLRALEEAGVKIDVVAGHGVGAASAALAAIGGASRLWEADGLWRSPSVAAFYRWKWPLRASAWLVILLAAVTAAVGALGALGLAAPPWVPLAPLVLLLLVAVTLAVGGVVTGRSGRRRRRMSGRPWWRLLGAPFDADPIQQAFARALWQLIRGASPASGPAASELGRRYAEVLGENLGQPGFREVMVAVTDLDARTDLVAALLREPHQREFVAPRPGRERGAEVVDLSGTGRDQAGDLVAGALTPPLACDPQAVTFGVDSYWRGETHRLCDRPGAIFRLLEELASAGVTQVVVVSAVTHPQNPHRLSTPRLELRHRLSEFLGAAEAAALRDALEMARLRFDSVYVIAPAHNPVGPFDMAGAYDEASDRTQDLVELMARAYEDASHQFIEPVVGASGERLASRVPASERL